MGETQSPHTESLEAAVAATKACYTEVFEVPLEQRQLLGRIINGLLNLSPSDEKLEGLSFNSGVKLCEDNIKIHWIFVTPPDQESEGTIDAQYGLTIITKEERIKSIYMYHIGKFDTGPDEYPRMFYKDGIWQTNGWYFPVHLDEILAKLSFLAQG